jgi:hypothetical protein
MNFKNSEKVQIVQESSTRNTITCGVKIQWCSVLPKPKTVYNLAEGRLSKDIKEVRGVPWGVVLSDGSGTHFSKSIVVKKWVKHYFISPDSKFKALNSIISVWNKQRDIFTINKTFIEQKKNRIWVACIGNYQ